jgi:hypothetical protein
MLVLALSPDSVQAKKFDIWFCSWGKLPLQRWVELETFLSSLRI